MDSTRLLSAYIKSFSDTPQDGSREEYPALCPTCRNPDRKFYINPGKGTFYCFQCRNSSYKEIVQAMASMLLGRPAAPYQGPATAPGGYVPPPISWRYVSDCTSALFSMAGKPGYDYLTKQRGFTPEILKYFKHGYDAKENAIVIPNFNGEDLYGINLRYLDPSAPTRYRYYGKKYLYNSRHLVLRSAQCVLFEGDLNVDSSIQLIPNLPAFALLGKSVFKGSYVDILRRYDKIYLFLDPDANQEAHQIANKLGRYRCYFVSLPPKYGDLNDVLKEPDAKSIYSRALRDARPLVTPILASVADFSTAACDIYSGKKYQAWSTGHQELDRITGGLRPGEITVVTGYTGVGKSTSMLDLSMNVMQQGVKPCVASFELPVASHVLPKLLSFSLHRNIEASRLSPDVFNKALALFGAKAPISFINRLGITPVEELLFGLNVAYKDGARFFVIDHLHFFIMPGPEERAEEDKFMQAMTEFKKTHPDAAFMIVVHHRKTAVDFKTGIPRDITLGDIKGTSRISQDADNVWIINRGHGQSPPILSVEKLRSDRATAIVGGKVRLVFDKGIYRYTVVPA